MKIILTTIITIYGGLMLFTSVLAMFQQSIVPTHLSLPTGLASGLLLTGVWFQTLIPIGVAALLLAALANGYAMYGVPDWKHFLIRGILSAIILILWWVVSRNKHP